MSASVKHTSRRTFFKHSVALAGMCLLTKESLAKPYAARSLGLMNLHTGESLNLVYWEEGRYIQESLQEINHVLRDHRSNEVHPIDANLLNQLHFLNRITENNKAYEVVSGYRSPATNAMLRKKGGGVAKRSLHMQGKAIDIYLPGLDMKKLRDAAANLKAGGVGLYRHFVHIDTGRVRYW